MQARLVGPAHAPRPPEGESPAAPAPSAAPGASGAEPTAASVDQLNALAARLGHPIYWAGPKAGYRYELTQTSTGKVFIRYLPDGSEGRRPEGCVPDRGDLSVPGRLRRGEEDGERHDDDQARARRNRRRRRRVPEEHPPRLPGRELPDRGLRPVSEQPAASSSPPARSRRSRSAGPTGRRSCSWPGSSFRSSSRCSRSAAGSARAAGGGPSLPARSSFPPVSRADRRWRASRPCSSATARSPFPLVVASRSPASGSRTPWSGRRVDGWAVAAAVARLRGLRSAGRPLRAGDVHRLPDP